MSDVDSESGTWPTETLPTAWEWVDFGDVFMNVTSSDRKLKQKDYRDEGELAVVDQGQQLVGGYTDRKDLKHPIEPPVVLFGDHTQCVKYLDFPFVQGADGTKILKPTDCVTPRFAYWSMKAVDLPNKGYSRHFKFLRDTKFPIPPLAEQRRIVSKIESLQDRSTGARAALAEVGPLLEQFRQSVLSAAFSGRLTADWRAANPDVEPASELLNKIQTERRRRWEQTELEKFEAKGQLGPKGWQAKYKEPPRPNTSHLPRLPRGWCWVSIDEIADKVSDGVHKKPHYVESGVPFLSVKNLTAGPGISFEGVRHITEQDHHEYIRRTHPEKGDILVTKDGTLGVIRLIDTDTPFSIFVSLALIKPVLAATSPFIARMLESPQGQAGMKATGSGLQHIHLIDLRASIVPLAPQEEQHEIVARLNRYAATIETRKADASAALADVDQLDQSILAKAFRGELVPQDPSDEPATQLLARIRTARQSNSSPQKNGKSTGSRGTKRAANA